MEGIKAYHGHCSSPMEKFEWLKSFNLLPMSRNSSDPLVVFGCYKREERRIISNYRGTVIVVWMGTDTHKRQNEFDSLKKKNIIHVTWLKPIQKYLIAVGVNCKLIKLPVKEHPHPDPVILGSKVYAYLSKGKPEYHGSNLVNSLDINHPLLVGDNSISQRRWYKGEGNHFYVQAFIGLALSDYVGGGMSIQEMAVRGIRVITNVMDLPNCIPWKDKEDVERIINKEAVKIGQSSNGLVEEVYDRLVEVRGCFDLEKLMV